MLDVDKFKIYNDTYGHQQGDVALKMVAKVITQSLRQPDNFAARWGGEEFAVLLANADKAAAWQFAEEIRGNVENTPVLCEGASTAQITVSIGTNTQIPEPNNLIGKFISNADIALYAAKKAGRNRVCQFNASSMYTLYS
jgi:diguanylate cyclase (GGDEF)-like protein